MSTASVILSTIVLVTFISFASAQIAAYCPRSTSYTPVNVTGNCATRCTYTCGPNDCELTAMGGNSTVVCLPPKSIAPFCPTALMPPGPSSTTLCNEGEACKYNCTGPTSSGQCSLAVDLAANSWNVTCINVFPITTTSGSGTTSSSNAPITGSSSPSESTQSSDPSATVTSAGSTTSSTTAGSTASTVASTVASSVTSSADTSATTSTAASTSQSNLETTDTGNAGIINLNHLSIGAAAVVLAANSLY